MFSTEKILNFLIIIGVFAGSYFVLPRLAEVLDKVSYIDSNVVMSVKDVIIVYLTRVYTINELKRINFETLNFNKK